MLEPSLLIDLYRSMLRIRRVEETLADHYAQQEIRCPMHLCIGQEAIAAGVCLALNSHDVVFSNHRAHGHYLAKGGDLKRMIAELYGKSEGCCGGLGGSMHLIDKAVGFLGSTPIVGGTVPLAVGAAWSFQLLEKRQVAIAFFGDGCFEEGVVHESLNFASLHKLPVIFVCENNQYSVYTHIKDRQPDRKISDIANAHGWRVWQGDGNDVVASYQMATQAVADAKSALGPQFIELDTYRWREHCGPDFDDHLGYRVGSDLSDWQRRCPIKRLYQRLVNNDAQVVSTLEHLGNTIMEEIMVAFEFAKSCPIPSPQPMIRRVFS